MHILNILLDNLAEEYRNLEWRMATYYYKPIIGWMISENGILYNYVTGEIRCGRDNSVTDKHQRISIKNKSYYISRIVAEAFVENDDPEKNTIVRHLNDDPLNNHYTNLKWGTSQENTVDAIRNKKIIYDEHRKYTRCEEHPRAILTNTDVENICKLLVNRIKLSNIANMYNVDVDVIRHIYKGHTWKPISSKYTPFPKQAVYHPVSNELRERIKRYLIKHPDAKAMEITKELNLEYNIRYKSLIGYIKRTLDIK